MDQKVDQFKIPEKVAAYSDGKHSERAIVIGSGFGGLAAAIRLAVKGYDVQILENTIIRNKKRDSQAAQAAIHFNRCLLAILVVDADEPYWKAHIETSEVAQSTVNTYSLISVSRIGKLLQKLLFGVNMHCCCAWKLKTA
jgi:heterodisulfide reductase subunit A-like polyferredoxin